jgi:hypothetical protein
MLNLALRTETMITGHGKAQAIKFKKFKNFKIMSIESLTVSTQF